MTDEHTNQGGQGAGDHWSNISRRGWLKALFSIPVVGVFLYNYNLTVWTECFFLYREPIE